jgi:DNA-binding NtrC family response regulator
MDLVAHVAIKLIRIILCKGVKVAYYDSTSQKVLHMKDYDSSPLNPQSFLQAFIVQSLRIAEMENLADEAGAKAHVEKVGLAASGCLEEVARERLNFKGEIDPEQYAELVADIKNHIGGQFQPASSGLGSIRVVNHCCPFGDLVKEAPELCRMTSSVFGAVAARNFGYAKVELHKRIATHDGLCDVRVYLDKELAANHDGDEYHFDDGKVTTKSGSSEVTLHLEECLRKAWCPPNDKSKWQLLKKSRRIVAESASMRKIIGEVEIFAPTLVTILVTGETGVGKEVVARAVHALSKRAYSVFLAVNCGAIPENLIESALFGHEKGAFTDAHQAHEGFFERTDGGTLFLDEVDSLPLSAQARLLRVLQEGEYERVGGHKAHYTDTRIIAASNSNLEHLIAEGRFRQDLYYRINVVPINIPPLRERPDDIIALVSCFLKKLAEKHDGASKVLSESSWAKVFSYSWPGNLRELENVLERSYLFESSSVIEDVFVPIVNEQDNPIENLREAKKKASMEVEARVVKNSLIRARGNVSAVARQIGITPRAMHMKLKTHGIEATIYRK